MGYTHPIDEAAMAHKVRQMKIALERAKEKLTLYREAHGGEYVGGVEYTQLIREIAEALAPIPSRPASGFF